MLAAMVSPAKVPYIYWITQQQARLDIYSWNSRTVAGTPACAAKSLSYVGAEIRAAWHGKQQTLSRGGVQETGL